MQMAKTWRRTPSVSFWLRLSALPVEPPSRTIAGTAANISTRYCSPGSSNRNDRTKARPRIRAPRTTTAGAFLSASTSSRKSEDSPLRASLTALVNAALTSKATNISPTTRIVAATPGGRAGKKAMERNGACRSSAIAPYAGSCVSQARAVSARTSTVVKSSASAARIAARWGRGRAVETVRRFIDPSGLLPAHCGRGPGCSEEREGRSKSSAERRHRRIEHLSVPAARRRMRHLLRLRPGAPHRIHQLDGRDPRHGIAPHPADSELARIFVGAHHVGASELVGKGRHGADDLH